jgi:Txe/YoeB family toxin of Txe-Axe toxin-antitoxin module
MLELMFMPKAWQDLGWWVKNEIKTVKKIYSVL